jgi:enamidase
MGPRERSGPSGDRGTAVSEPLLLFGAGCILSGLFEDPVAKGDAMFISEGRLGAVGRRNDVDPGGPVRRIDVHGGTIVPGLVDPHTHPVLGDYTPRQNTTGWVTSYLHGGVTTLVSAGETHWPGRPKSATGAKAMAIAACLSSATLRPGGAKLVGGALLLEHGLNERDFDEMDAAGVRLLGEVGLGSVIEPDELLPMVAWARARGWTVPMHVGGASVPGSNVVGADLTLAVQPDVASHLNGGPTARPINEIRQIIEGTAAAVEVVQAGNLTALVSIVALLRERREEARLQIATDTPSGTGVIPLGMLRTIASCVSLGGLEPELAICCATGSTAQRYGLDSGKLSAGRPADVVVLQAPLGGATANALDALWAGDTPAVALAVVDGEVQLSRSRMTPPPVHEVEEVE